MTVDVSNMSDSELRDLAHKVKSEQSRRARSQGNEIADQIQQLGVAYVKVKLDSPLRPKYMCGARVRVDSVETRRGKTLLMGEVFPQDVPANARFLRSGIGIPPEFAELIEVSDRDIELSGLAS